MPSVTRVYIIFLAALLVSMVSGAALAAEIREEMFLTGSVQRIDLRAKEVVVNLRNKGCKGTRTFKVMGSDIKKLSTGKEIEFFIDSGRCPGSEAKLITKLWSVK